MLRVWILAIRPKTLWASISPVLLGTAMAAHAGRFNLLMALACLAFSVLVQIGTNFTNDYCDFFKGADTADRKGPLRVTQAGLVAPGTMLRATIFVFVLAGLMGLILMETGGWPLGVICAISILSGILYTAGPYPLGYYGWGDIFVLIFFGPVAVGLTYFVQAGELPLYVLVGGLAPGLLSTAILAVNNLRDIDGDARCGKRTLAVRFGVTFARLEYLLCILGAGWTSLFLIFAFDAPSPLLATLAIIPLAIPTTKKVWSSTEGAVLNQALGDTGKLLPVYTLLYAIGLML